jgi:hypothetical protein
MGCDALHVDGNMLRSLPFHRRGKSALTGSLGVLLWGARFSAVAGDEETAHRHEQE